MNTLLSWIGFTDIRASNDDGETGVGPIAEAVLSRDFDEVVLFADLDKSKTAKYEKWLRSKKQLPIRLIQKKLSGPTNFGEIYTSVVETIKDLASEPHRKFTYHLSPGTPAMAAVWIIIAKTRFPAELIESSREAGVRTVSVPFDISAEFIPGILSNAENELQKFSDEFADAASTFFDIIHQSSEMKSVVRLAQRLAAFDQPVLIEGESGTGKELFAKAIHKASARGERPFVAVNCGAIPADLVESELFGHEKGAFTGATGKQVGKFVLAESGTIFLDEIGELPLQAQVKLLRVLQEREVTPVGGTTPVPLNVRVISATNRTLIEEAARGAFREDLFYRLAIFVLNIPPLRQRSGDLSMLIQYFLEQLNAENTGRFWLADKTLSPNARNVLLNHAWPGNVRELQATLLRATMFSQGETIDEHDVNQSIFTLARSGDNTHEYPSISGEFSIQSVVRETARHYLIEAIRQSHGNKSKAAKMLGLPSYQTFLNWWRKYVGT